MREPVPSELVFREDFIDIDIDRSMASEHRAWPSALSTNDRFIGTEVEGEDLQRVRQIRRNRAVIVAKNVDPKSTTPEVSGDEEACNSLNHI